MLAFALQCTCYRKLIFIFNLFSAPGMGVAGWRGGTTDLCSGRQKPRAAIVHPRVDLEKHLLASLVKTDSRVKDLRPYAPAGAKKEGEGLKTSESDRFTVRTLNRFQLCRHISSRLPKTPLLAVLDSNAGSRVCIVTRHIVCVVVRTLDWTCNQQVAGSTSGRRIAE